MDGACIFPTLKMLLVEMKLKMRECRKKKIADSKDPVSAPSIILTVPTEGLRTELVSSGTPRSSLQNPGPQRDRIAYILGGHRDPEEGRKDTQPHPSLGVPGCP